MTVNVDDARREYHDAVRLLAIFKNATKGQRLTPEQQARFDGMQLEAYRRRALWMQAQQLVEQRARERQLRRRTIARSVGQGLAKACLELPFIASFVLAGLAGLYVVKHVNRPTHRVEQVCSYDCAGMTLPAPKGSGYDTPACLRQPICRVL